jgi:hypothetical protein
MGLTCSTDMDCDDGHACTIDTCSPSSICTYIGLDGMCPAGQTCAIGRGCVMGMTCSTDADCADAHDCTINLCGSGSPPMCRAPVPDSSRCPSGQMCDATRGCVAMTGCSSSADCNDSIACTVDSCRPDRTCQNMPFNDMCMPGETCSPTVGCYVPMPCTTAAECQDGNFCNGAEECVTEFGCRPAATPRMCNDSEDCTVDTCDTTTDMCAFRCDPTRGPACMAMCPPVTSMCEGRFMTTVGTVLGCSGGIICPAVGVDWSEVTFAIVDGFLEARPRNYMTTPPVPGGIVLTDAMEPVCPMFEATVNVGGGCIEDYFIRGTFTDADHFTGTVEWRYTDMDGFSCSLCSCSNGTMPIMGTRIP